MFGVLLEATTYCWGKQADSADLEALDSACGGSGAGARPFAEELLAPIELRGKRGGRLGAMDPPRKRRSRRHPQPRSGPLPTIEERYDEEGTPSRTPVSLRGHRAIGAHRAEDATNAAGETPPRFRRVGDGAPHGSQAARSPGLGSRDRGARPPASAPALRRRAHAARLPAWLRRRVWRGSAAPRCSPAA